MAILRRIDKTNNSPFNREDYAQLRKLWAETFGDSADDIDEFYANWGDDCEGYVLEDEENPDVVASALTLFKMGEFVIPGETVAKPVYTSYAICTSKSARGKGFGSAITKFVSDDVLVRGGISVLSPAEPSLVKFYQRIGYEPRFYAMEHSVMASASEANACKVAAEEYNEIREKLLADIPHIRLSEKTLRYTEHCSNGFYSMLDGKIIVATEAGSNRFPEVIFDNKLEPEELRAALSALANQLGLESVTYRIPGNEYLDSGELHKEYVQAMIARDAGANYSTSYFGFTFD